MIHWFLHAPGTVVFSAGAVIGVPLWLLVLRLPVFRLPEDPYARAQRQYERERDAYQKSLRDKEAGV